MIEQDENTVEAPAKPQFSLSQKFGIGASGSFIAIGGTALLHAPPPLAVAGLVGACVLAVKSPAIYQEMRNAAPFLPDINNNVRQVRIPGEYTFTERLMGKHLNAPLVTDIHDETTPRTEVSERTLPTEGESGYEWDYNDDEDGIPALNTSSGKFLFSDILAEGFVPSLHKIFIGRLTDGTPIYVEAKDLCHVALAGSTGNGKSSLMRLLMAQLCKVGARVLLLNPHYMRYEHDSGEDWTPFDPYLEQSAHDCSQYAHMERLLKFIVEKTLPDRIERAYHGEPVGRPYFIVIDELPAIVAELPNAPGYIAKLLREGRKYGIFLIVASQDFLVKTTGMDGGGVRQCFRTACYVGGDATTAKVLLARQKDDAPIHESDLGKGTIMLRCKATGKAVIAKVPYVDNDSLYRLLGPSTFTAPTRDNATAPSYAPPSQASAYPVAHAPITRERARQSSDYPSLDAAITRHTGPLQPPVERAHTTTVPRQRYKLMNEMQQVQFVAAYRVKRNMDYCLKQAGCSSLYRDHARELIREHGLRGE